MTTRRPEPEPPMSPRLALVTIAGFVLLAIAGTAIRQFFHDGFPGPGQD